MINKRYNYELLAPAGDMDKLKTALYFGADAVYAGGKRFGLRAGATNFDEQTLTEAVNYVHSLGKKMYITMNIFPSSEELDDIAEYGKFLQDINMDGAIVSDFGVFSVLRENAPNLSLHVSTQANVMNLGAAKMWAKMGATRIVLARELTLEQIKTIREGLDESVELEAFIHGAMCISYSGRCLLSSYFSSRGGNRGQCVQCCRWDYSMVEKKSGKILDIEQDERGTYILSGKDLCMINHMRELAEAGVVSFKIEGRIKSEYYVAATTNAYRRALDNALAGEEVDNSLSVELDKVAHRGYDTGFYMGTMGGETGEMKFESTHSFIAVVLESGDGYAKIEMRNKFCVGDELEVLAPTSSFNKIIKVTEMHTEKGEEVIIANRVKQILILKTDVPLNKYDLLRRKI